MGSGIDVYGMAGDPMGRPHNTVEGLDEASKSQTGKDIKSTHLKRTLIS